MLALALGAGALAQVPFLLGVTGYLSVANVRLACCALALLFVLDARAVLQRVWLASSKVSRPPIWFSGWLLALFPGLFLTLLSALTPTIDPDGLSYHLTVPKRWLAMGSLGYLPTYPYSNTPMGVEMLFTLGLAWAGDVAAKLVEFSLGIAAALGLYAAARRVTAGVLPALGVTLLLYGPFGIASLMGWAYVEAATAGALVGAGLAWVVWHQTRDSAFLRVAGLLAGIGASFKITAALVPVALGALTLLLLVREQREQGKPAGPSVKLLLTLVPFVALPVLPWLVRSAIVTGNPFFPMFAQIVPSRDLTAIQSAQFDQYNRYLVWGVGSGAGWGLGIRKAILAGVAGLIALAGAAIFRRQRSFPMRALTLVVLFTVLLQLAAAGLYKRYWTPLFALIEIPMLLLLLPWAQARWARVPLVVLTAVLSLIGAKQQLGAANGDAASLLKTSFGFQGQHDYLRRQLPLLPLYEQLNRDAPANAGVVLAGYCGGFYIDRATFCADIVQSSLRVTSWQDFTLDLRRLGVTHVIAPRDWLVPLPTSGSPPPVEVGNTSYLIRHQERIMIGRLLRDHSRLLASASDQGLFLLASEGWH